MRGRFSSTIFSTYYLMSICQKSMVFIALPLPATLMAPTYQNQMQRLSCNFFSNHQWWWHKNCCCFEQKLPATQDFQGCFVEVKFHCPGMGACCCTFISVVCVLYCSQQVYTIDNVPAHNVTVKNIFSKRWNLLKNVLIYFINVKIKLVIHICRLFATDFAHSAMLQWQRQKKNHSQSIE